MRHATHLIILEAIQKPAGLPVYSLGPSEPRVQEGNLLPPPDFWEEHKQNILLQKALDC